MKNIFDNYIENSFGNYTQAEFKLEQFYYNYKQFMPSGLSSKLLDIGIGRGEMLSCMRDWGYAEYIGIDVSPSTVDFCKSLGLNCILVADTVKWLSDKESYFDVITLLDVLEHFAKDDVIVLLQSLYKSLRPGGKIIIQVPNMQAPDAQLHRYNDITHNIGFTEHSLQQVLITAGIQNFTFHGFEGITDNTIKSRIVIMLRSLYWRYCRFIRRLNTNLNPAILNPVFFSVVTK
jgi:2-polyprenyl-3-methyl-5-hydroxy-6-metoxy-1,4-benzoquinol methylase